MNHTSYSSYFKSMNDTYESMIHTSKYETKARQGYFRHFLLLFSYLGIESKVNKKQIFKK